MSDTSSSSSTHLHSPSPSPRSMRRNTNQQLSLSNINSRSSSLLQQSFPPPTNNTHSSRYPSSQRIHHPRPSNSLLIPHSHDDLDRIRLEEQLGGISLLSSSRASDSMVTNTNTGVSYADEDEEEDEEEGSSVEIGRAAGVENLSAASGGMSPLGGASFSATTVFPSPTSTNGHHASAITLRAGLTGAGARAQPGGFDEDRELGQILDHRGESVAGAFSSLKNQPSFKLNNPTPSSRPKLVDAITRNFSPRRPSSNTPIASANAYHHRTNTNNYTSDVKPQESRFEMLAKGVAQTATSSEHIRKPMSELSFHDSREHRSVTSLRRGNSNGSQSKRNPNKSASSKRNSGSKTGQQHPSFGFGDGKSALFLPDVTGLTDGLIDSPVRKGKRVVQEGLHRDDPHAYPMDSLATLSQRLSTLTTENKHTLQRVSELETELQTTRERETAAKEEWALERDALRRERDAREQAGFDRGHREGKEVGSPWEQRYWEVVEEKKQLEGLVGELRMEVTRLTTMLQNQTAMIAELQNQRILDQKEIQTKGEEIDSLREEVRKLAFEVGSLRRVVEDSVVERKERAREEADARERYQLGLQQQFRQQQQMEERERESRRKELSDVLEQEEDVSLRSNSSRAGKNKVGADELARLRTTIATHQTKRSSPSPSFPHPSSPLPAERPSSRLSEGIRVAAVSSPTRSPPLPSLSPRFSNAGLQSPLIPRQAVQPTTVPLPHSPDLSSLSDTPRQTRRSKHRTSEEKAKKREKVLEPVLLETSWASSFEQEEVVMDEEEEGMAGPSNAPLSTRDEEALIDLRDREEAKSRKAHHTRRKSSRAEEEVRLPPQTVLCRVLRELEVDYEHYKTIYSDLAEQYKFMDPASNAPKRNVLAEHLKEVIDTLEQKGDQIASLYSLLSFADRPLPASSTKDQAKAYKSVKDLLRTIQQK